MTQDTSANYGLILSFAGLFASEVEERAFVLGVEFGQLWSRMREGREAEIAATTHEANRDVLARAAAADGWDIECQPSGTPGWDYTTLKKARAAKPNPHGIRVVRSEA